VLSFPPNASVKGPATLELWTEVVRKGKNKSKTRSMKEKIDVDDRCMLKY
jgi:hypothetical protein